MYDNYIKYIDNILENNNISNFKSNPDYNVILEHVNFSQGLEYLNCIEKKTNISREMIKEFCELNDKIGDPVKFNFLGFHASPTSLRYIYHSHLIFEHIKKLNLNNLDLVEIGGGYGGLCFAMHYFSKFYNININSYTIIDINCACKLQKLYLELIDYNIPNVKHLNSDTFGSDIKKDNLFLISNYCFSEIQNELQQKYIEILFPKISHGFMVWNLIPYFNFGFKVDIEDEIPYTGGGNKYIYF